MEKLPWIVGSTAVLFFGEWGKVSPAGGRTGGVPPAGEVLSSDGKYPKITGAAAPDPGEPSGGEAGW